MRLNLFRLLHAQEFGRPGLEGNRKDGLWSTRHLWRVRQPVASTPSVRVKHFTDASRQHAYDRMKHMREDMSMLCRNLVINGRRTSLRLEAEFWISLEDMARQRGVSVAALVSQVDMDRGETPLTRFIRVLCISHFREALRRLAGTSGIAGGDHHSSRHQHDHRADPGLEAGHLAE